MLFKNEEQIHLNKAEIDGVVSYFHGKFPVKIIYPPDRVVPSRLPHNRKPDKPASISFDLKSIVKTDSGSETWRYADDIIIDGKGRKRYMPKKFLFSGERFLRRDDIDLIFFLLRKSEHRLISDEELKANKKLKQARSPKFTFEDLVTEAEKRQEKKMIDTKINGLLYGEDFGLPEQKLRDLAKAYFVSDVDNKTLAQIRWVLDSKIHETKDSIDKFFSMVNAEEEIKTRVSIQKAMDMEVLRFDAMKKAWFWDTTGENGKTTICKVPPNKSASEALYEYYQGDQGFRDDLQAVLLTKNPNAGKSKAKEPATATDE